MKSVPLGKERWPVRVVKDAAKHAARKDDELAHHGPLRGYIDWQNKEIVVESDAPHEMASTLLHESLHKAFPFLDDDAIANGEVVLFPMLWRYGWRPFG